MGQRSLHIVERCCIAGMVAGSLIAVAAIARANHEGHAGALGKASGKLQAKNRVKRE
jgi:hypothetical protein